MKKKGLDRNGRYAALMAKGWTVEKIAIKEGLDKSRCCAIVRPDTAPKEGTADYDKAMTILAYAQMEADEFWPGETNG